MMRLRLRVMVAGYNQAVAEYTLARLEISAAHPRIVAPPVIDRLGAFQRARDPAAAWRAAIRQVRSGEAYVRTGASAVARRHPAWSRLTGAFGALREYAHGIEVLHTMAAGRRRKGRS
ncbi:MAG: hypothetical protein JO293_01090 [Candidatus Eremiobacteraeota bacterium]|nr:hypothetical protein [Candidatus Eremiobacteraeota bacterium]MBV8221937.1 hypothetical protein [Candidatus Eremiobacteraeota bacterium]MBV8281375.1 hypothetical protein [Candidatus Eremiobacteraeota bacterium]